MDWLLEDIERKECPTSAGGKNSNEVGEGVSKIRLYTKGKLLWERERLTNSLILLSSSNFGA